MISILVCSISPVDLDHLKKSIACTIGQDSLYEIIFFDNRIHKYGITKVYNILANKAKYPNLVFVHEDVEFINIGWDHLLLKLLQDKQNGVIGIAGSTYLPSVPSGWYLPDEKYNNVYIHQGFKYKNTDIRFDNKGEDLTPVYLLDGVFLAMRKEIWEEFSFNEKLMGFHAYDVDICQRVSSKYKNIFTKQIEILHKSEGKVDRSYFEALITYKKDFIKFNYEIIDYEIEYQILLNLHKSLMMYYEEKICVEILKPYIKIKNLGLARYFSIKRKLK